MPDSEQYYPLEKNPALVDLWRAHKACGMTFEHFRTVHAKGACDQLSPEDLEKLESK